MKLSAFFLLLYALETLTSGQSRLSALVEKVEPQGARLNMVIHNDSDQPILYIHGSRLPQIQLFNELGVPVPMTPRGESMSKPDLDSQRRLEIAPGENFPMMIPLHEYYDLDPDQKYYAQWSTTVLQGNQSLKLTSQPTQLFQGFKTTKRLSPFHTNEMGHLEIEGGAMAPPQNITQGKSRTRSAQQNAVPETSNKEDRSGGPVLISKTRTIWFTVGVVTLLGVLFTWKKIK